VDFARLDEIDDPNTQLMVKKACLLHDVPEDYSYSVNDLADVLGLNDQEMILLDLLDRKSRSENAYWMGILKNPVALRIKLADRIANLHDLRRWIVTGGQDDPRARNIYSKYCREKVFIQRKFDKMYSQGGQDDSTDTLRGMVQEIQEILSDIELS